MTTKASIIADHYVCCRQMGIDAALRGIPTDSNPFTEGGKGSYYWLEGHRTVASLKARNAGGVI